MITVKREDILKVLVIINITVTKTDQQSTTLQEKRPIL